MVLLVGWIVTFQYHKMARHTSELLAWSSSQDLKIAKSPKNAANSSRCTLPTLRLAYSDDWVDVFDKRLEQAPPGG